MCNTNYDIDLSDKSHDELHDLLYELSLQISSFKKEFREELKQADGEDPLIQDLGNMINTRFRIVKALNK